METVRVTTSRYCFLAGEPLDSAASRILSEQLSSAINVLSSRSAPRDEAIHDARRFIKRARSLLRLIRPAIGPDYPRENRRLRAAGRQLSNLRDAQAVIESVLALEAMQESPIARLQLRATRDELIRRERKNASSPRTKSQIRSAVSNLTASLEGIARLTLEGLDLDLLNDALDTTVKRGRKACLRAWKDSDPGKLHDLRKRVKDLRFQSDLLAAVSPRVNKVRSQVAEKLDQLLGDNQNLNVLGKALRRIHLPGGLQESIEARQATLRKEARDLSTRLYDE